VSSTADSTVTLRRPARNAFWLLLGELVGKAASFVFVVVVARAALGLIGIVIGRREIRMLASLVQRSPPVR
jgi:hypothetical protein